MSSDPQLRPKRAHASAELVYSWRTKIIELLSSPIESEAQPEAGTHIEDPEAEYYAQALQAQGEIEAYLIAYAAAVGDRRGACDPVAGWG